MLAVTFVKVQHPHFRRKLLQALLSDTISSCAFNGCGSYAHFNLFPIQTSIEKKMCEGTLLALHRFVIQYLHEDYSMGQTVV